MPTNEKVYTFDELQIMAFAYLSAKDQAETFDATKPVQKQEPRMITSQQQLDEINRLCDEYEKALFDWNQKRGEVWSPVRAAESKMNFAVVPGRRYIFTWKGVQWLFLGRKGDFGRDITITPWLEYCKAQEVDPQTGEYIGGED